MRLLLCLALLAIVAPSLQQASSTTRNSTGAITPTVAPTEKPAPPPPSPPSRPSPPGSTKLDCPAYCPRIYRPVCARFEGKLRTYANICLLRSDIDCARRRGVAARYNIFLVRRTHCNARRRRRPGRGGRRPRRRPRPIRVRPNGGKGVNSRVLDTNP
uniref:Enhancer of split M1 protein n=1 Tax=Zeugodacus cucurbitae TaxID=28588 RepID=A0A0A1WQU8_ZEUCU